MIGLGHYLCVSSFKTLSNTFFPKDTAYSILELSKMTEKAEKNQNFQVFMFTYFLVTKMIMMFGICSKFKKNSF